MFARSASIALAALLSLHGIDMVDARVGAAGTTGILDAFRASQATGAPSASPVSPAPTLPVPTGSPSDSPAPSPAPSGSPTVKPPTTSPSSSPAPSPSPSSSPTLSKAPTPLPTSGPPTTSPVVTDAPSDTQQPSPSPSGSPSTPMPTTTPSDSPQPSPSPTRNTPTDVPTKTLAPSETPTVTAAPSPGPSAAPSKKGSEAPSKSPAPSENPTSSPKPSPGPSITPTISKRPTPGPTAVPTVSNEPSKTIVPSITTVPSLEPSFSSEPSISDVPSAVPSESEEPSISDVPTTSANPTADDASYLVVTVTWTGDSDFTISQANANFDTNPTCTSNPLLGLSGDGSTNVLTLTCDKQTTNLLNPNAFYDIVITQNTDVTQMPAGTLVGSNTFYDYVVDFKVDGETVPELSGEMKAFGIPNMAALPTTVPEVRNFQFTNNVFNGVPGAATEVFESGAPQQTQLSPAKCGNWLEVVISGPAASTDMYALSSKSPLDMLGNPACGADIASTTLTAPDFSETIVCPAFVAATGENPYEFFLEIDDADSQPDEYSLTFIHNGVVVTPTRTVPGETAPDINMFPDIQVIGVSFRADSEEAPLVEFGNPADIVFTVTWEGDDQIDISEGGAAAECIFPSNTFNGPLSVQIVCPTLATFATPITFNVGKTDMNAPDLVFDVSFVYLGEEIPELSGTTTTGLAASTDFIFEIPAAGAAIAPGASVTPPLA